jgi:hypothetical protein
MGLDEGHDFRSLGSRKLLLKPKLMIGRMKASRTAGEAAGAVAAAAMRNPDFRKYIGGLILLGSFVQELAAKARRALSLGRGLA